MSQINELIAELCPDGVEFVKIEDLFEIKNGYTPSKSNSSFWENGTVPWFRMEDIRANGRVLSHSLQLISKSAVKSGKLFPPNSLLIATSATIGEHALITVPHLSNQRFTSLAVKDQWASQVEIKFLYHYAFVLDEWCRSNTTTSSFASVDMTGFRKFRFPVPPLEVQREIVRVLDKFTELEGELEARRRQYEYYRARLFATDSTAVFSPLGVIAKNLDSRRKPVTREARNPGTIPYYGASGVVDHVSDYIFDGDYLLVSEDGANLLTRAAPIAFSISGKTWVNNHAHVLEFASHTERRFVELYLNSIDLTPFVSGAAQPKLNKAKLSSIPIPNPPAETKERTVQTLDKLEAFVNDLSVGLPAELAARRKQYEYYRNRLLTFEEKR
ncbi:MAG: restriction endonuclease subunit S [Propionibacteriaceae bacterium]|nr:restriction endonuclease subunit S [Propionibacteriaceae bacterium]